MQKSTIKIVVFSSLISANMLVWYEVMGMKLLFAVVCLLGILFMAFFKR